LLLRGDDLDSAKAWAAQRKSGCARDQRRRSAICFKRQRGGRGLRAWVRSTRKLEEMRLSAGGDGESISDVPGGSCGASRC